MTTITVDQIKDYLRNIEPITPDLDPTGNMETIFIQEKDFRIWIGLTYDAHFISNRPATREQPEEGEFEFTLDPVEDENIDILWRLNGEFHPFHYSMKNGEEIAEIINSKIII